MINFICYYSNMSNEDRMLHSYADAASVIERRSLTRAQAISTDLLDDGTFSLALPPSQTCSVSPIAPDHRTLDKCLHETSMMKASSPHVFVRYPYRPSMMTLLRKLETYPCDPIHKDPITRTPTVYASIQNHWSPAINCPVLTIVTACDTSVSQPFFHRLAVDFARVSFYFSTDTDQSYCSFDLPLIIPASKATFAVTVDLKTSTDSVDILNCYEIRARNYKKPIFRINCFQLAPMTCTVLHDTSLHIPFQQDYPQERFILGLSGCRDTVYKIHYPDLNTPITFLLDEEDIIAIGLCYKQLKGLPEIKATPHYGYNDPLIPKLAWRRPSRVDFDPQLEDWSQVAIIHSGVRKTYYHVHPIHTVLYPPLRKHKILRKDVRISPLKFPPGYVLYRFTDDVLRCKVIDFIDDIVTCFELKDRLEAKRVFARLFNTTIEHTTNSIDMEMQKFLLTVEYKKPTFGKVPIWYVPKQTPDMSFSGWSVRPPHDDLECPTTSLVSIYEPDEQSRGLPITVHNCRMHQEDINETIRILVDRGISLAALNEAIQEETERKYNTRETLSHLDTTTEDDDSDTKSWPGSNTAPTPCPSSKNNNNTSQDSSDDRIDDPQDEEGDEHQNQNIPEDLSDISDLIGEREVEMISQYVEIGIDAATQCIVRGTIEHPRACECEDCEDGIIRD